MRLSITLTILAIAGTLTAQDNFLKNYAPVAPTPASLGKYGDIPVNYHTGLPDISVPIHTLSEGGVSLPIHLSYHASGIKVQETASWVGLGWALNAGGIITRTVQNAPDEGGNLNQTTGFYKSFGHSLVQNSPCQDFQSAADGLMDTEPDIFNFNINGYAGKFFFDAARNIQLVPQQDLKIEVVANASGSNFNFDGWIVTDPQGTRYHFAATSGGMNALDYIETTATSTDFSIAGSWREVRSSWYLSKIESADRKDVITFAYAEEKYAFWNMSGGPGASTPNNCLGGYPFNPTKTRITGKRLTGISGSNGAVTFTGETAPRADLSYYYHCASNPCPTINTEAKRLKTVDVLGKDGVCLRRFDFAYSTYTAVSTGEPPSTALPQDQTDKQRVFLSSVTESACGASTNTKVHSFDYYDPGAMPRRFSMAQDHWGYYNGKSNSTFEPGWPYGKTPCNLTCLYPNYSHKCTATAGKRDAAFPAMRNGSLQKITYPTGGTTTFHYGAHTIWKADTTCTETPLNGSGGWSLSGGSCNGSNSAVYSLSFTASEISNGHLDLSWTPWPGCSTGYASLGIRTSPNGPNLTTISPGKYWLNNLNGVALQSGVTYYFALQTVGIATVKIYTLLRNYTSANRAIGGLRVDSIATNDGLTTTNIVKKFDYGDKDLSYQSSGVLLYMPMYATVFVESLTGNSNVPPNCTYADNSYTASTCPASPLLAAFSYTGLQPMQTTMGSHIGYKYVSVSETNNGKIRYAYNIGYVSPWMPSGYPFQPPPFDPVLGKTASETVFDNSGNILSETLYDYTTNTSTAVSGALKMARVMAGSQARAYNIATGYSLPIKTTDRQYTPGTANYLQTVRDIGYTFANGHYQKTTEDVTNSDGTIYRTKYKYAKDYPCPSGTACDENNGTNADAKSVYAMRRRNMVAIPIEQTTWLKKTGWASFRLTGATFFQFDKVNTDYNNLKLKTVQQVRPAAPLTTFVESSTSGGAFSKDGSYNTEYNFVFSDAHGKALSQWKQNDIAKQQYIWGHNQKLPIAKTVKAESNQVAFASFEEVGTTAVQNGNWSLTGEGGGWTTTEFYTGRQGWEVGQTRQAVITVPVGSYLVSCWVKNGFVRANGTNMNASTSSAWQYAERVVSSDGTTAITISGNSYGTFIDELRLHPTDALMRTFSFDDRSQLLLSIADENSVAAHYEYDNFQRLQGVRDQDRNLVQTMEYNYRPGGGVLNDVRTRAVLTAGQTTLTQVQALTGSDVRRVFQYFDGLGRPIQTNEVGQSPATNDVVAYQVYDVYGREAKKYLPYTAVTNGGAYRAAAASEQSTFINTFGAGGYGYAETAFEASPLNRPTAQSAPGATWRLGTATPRYQRFAWRSNTVADAVRDFTNNNSFAANALWMNEEIDENGRSRFSFTDKMGRTVLVRQPLNATETAQTYTVYDDFGRVACVIPPEATKRMAGSSNWDWTSATYASMVFKYTYDARGRMTAKTVPSAGTTTIAYDRLDRPVLTTDANGVKLFTRYDVLSRPVITGRYVGSATGPNNTESLSETSNTVAPHYYTTTTFPAGTDAANTHVYKVLYYDDYDLDNNGSLGAGETYTNPAESGYDAAAFLRTRGKPTASKTAIIPNSPINSPTPPSFYLITRTYYDKEYAVIQVNKQNHLGGSDITSSAYDFANRLTKTRRDHTATPPGGTLKTYSIREEYVFDHAGRVRFVRHKINTNNWTVTSAPLYDELGRLLDKRLHASNYDGTSAVTLSSTFSYLQSLDYTYNIRGWLTGVNDVSSCAVQGGDNLADVFSLKLDYDAPTGGGTAQYNGNISTMQWRTYIGTTCLTQQQYRFTYDYANRLTAADHYTHNGTAWTFTNNYSESGITYDFNGNIKTYTRRGQTPSASFNTIDQLTYTYGDTNRPDRLTQVADAALLADRPKGFVPTTGTITGDHYIYDANGNMTTDNHKGFVIQYNYLNLPIVMTKGANVITMTYTADGEKLTKAVTGGGATKNYVGGIEYSGANLEAIYHGEGRCTPNGATAFFYEYTVKDHLGNARVNFRANGAAVTFLEELHYYPFGMIMEGIGTAAVTQNKYRYNGKEMNDDFGLNWSDYGARWYDASLGRWWSVDNLVGAYPSNSPFSYALDNPINAIDKDGNYVIVPYLSQQGLARLNSIIQSYFGKNVKLGITNKPRGVDMGTIANAQLMITKSGNLDESKQAAFEYLNTVFNDKNKTAYMSFVEGKSTNDGYDNGLVSIAELEEYAGMAAQGIPNMAMAMLLHEISEQWYKQTVLKHPQATPLVDNLTANDYGYKEAHYYATVIESLITGLLRISMENHAGGYLHYFYKVNKDGKLIFDNTILEKISGENATFTKLGKPAQRAESKIKAAREETYKTYQEIYQDMKNRMYGH